MVGDHGRDQSDGIIMLAAAGADPAFSVVLLALVSSIKVDESLSYRKFLRLTVAAPKSPYFGNILATLVLVDCFVFLLDSR